MHRVRRLLRCRAWPVPLAAGTVAACSARCSRPPGSMVLKAHRCCGRAMSVAAVGRIGLPSCSQAVSGLPVRSLYDASERGRFGRYQGISGRSEAAVGTWVYSPSIIGTSFPIRITRVSAPNKVGRLRYSVAIQAIPTRRTMPKTLTSIWATMPPATCTRIQ